MLISEVIQRVQSLYSKGVHSDDTRLSSRHIYNKLISSRAKVLSQKLGRKSKISDWSYDNIDCIELIEANPYECPCLPPLGCKILRSKYPIPKVVTGRLYNGINSVTSVDGSIIFSYVTWKEKKYRKGNKYTANKPDYFIRNDYLYITVKQPLKIISISALFVDPIEVKEYKNYCNDKDCIDCDKCFFAEDLDFNLDENLIDSVIQLTVEEILNIFVKVKEDQVNNSKDSLTQESK